MPETGSNGSTETLPSTAEQAKEIKRLEDSLRKKDKELKKEREGRAKDKADSDHRIGVQANTLVEMAEKVGKQQKQIDDLMADKQEPVKSHQAGSDRKGINPYDALGIEMRAAGHDPDKVPANEEEFYTRSGAPTAQERTLEEMGSKMRSAGMTQDTPPAHEEEFYTRPEEVIPPLPPVPPAPGPIPELTPPRDVLADKQAEYSEKLRNLDLAIKSFAISRVERERMFSGGQAKNDIEVMGGELNRVFEVWSQSLASMLAEQYKEVTNGGAEVKANLEGWRSQLVDLGNMPIADRPADYDTSVRMAEQNVRYLENWNSAVEQRIQEIEQYHDTIINNRLMSIRTQVDAAMTAERIKRHPQLSKVSNWLRTHKKTRMLAGVAMTGIAVGSAAVGFLPGVAGAVAGRTALRGLGGYEAVRGAGDWLADRGANKEPYAKGSMNQYLPGYVESAKKQSGRKHRWNRGAAAAGVGLAAAPFIASAIHGAEAAPSNPAQPANPNAPQPTGPKAPIGPNAPTPNGPIAPTGPNIPTNPGAPSISPENQEAFARYLGATSKGPEAGANFNSMFGATPDQLAGLQGTVSLEHLSDPNWMQGVGLTSDAAKNQFNYLLGQASTSPEGAQNFIDNLPATLTQLRGLNNAI